jgi:hypothetical protein
MGLDSRSRAEENTFLQSLAQISILLIQCERKILSALRALRDSACELHFFFGKIFLRFILSKGKNDISLRQTKAS